MPESAFTFLDALAAFDAGLGGSFPVDRSLVVPSPNGAAETASSGLPAVPFPSVASRLERSTASPDVAACARVALPTPLGNTGFPNTITTDSDKSLSRGDSGESGNLIGANNQPIKAREHTGSLVDYLAFTVHADLGDYRAVVEWLTPSGCESDWVETGGKNGYLRGFLRENIRVWYDGLPGMGVHVVLSGQGCRQLEREWGTCAESAWVSWLVSLRRLGKALNVARVDVAKDDTDGVLDMSAMLEKTKAGETSGFLRSWSVGTYESGELGKQWEPAPGGDSQTITYGNRRGNMWVKIYNKQTERLEAGESGSESGHWVRVEATFKNRAVDNFLDLLSQIPSLDVAAAWVQQSISFVEPSETDTNKSRWGVCSWWSSFWESVPKLGRRVAPKVARTLAQCHAWAARQVAPILAVVADVIHADAKRSGLDGVRLVRRYLVSLLESGRSRRRSKHETLLVESLASIKRNPPGCSTTAFRTTFDYRGLALLPVGGG